MFTSLYVSSSKIALSFVSTSLWPTLRLFGIDRALLKSTSFMLKYSEPFCIVYDFASSGIGTGRAWVSRVSMEREQMQKTENAQYNGVRTNHLLSCTIALARVRSSLSILNSMLSLLVSGDAA